MAAAADIAEPCFNVWIKRNLREVKTQIPFLLSWILSASAGKTKSAGNISAHVLA
jgi:hypothetical protein